MQFNGGFAGEGEKARFVAGGGVGSHYFNQRNTSSTHFGSYDQFFPKLRSGIGLTYRGYNYGYYHYNIVGEFRHRENSLMLSFSPKFSSKGKRTFAPFIDLIVGYAKNSTVLDMPDYRPGVMRASGRIGVLYNSRKFYAGITYYAFTTSVFTELHSFYRATGHPPVLQTGYILQRLPESRFSFTPHLAFFLVTRIYSSKRWYELNLDLNLMFRYKKFIWSLNNTGLGLGYQNKRFRILLSQNYIYFNKLNLQNSLSLRYVLK